MWRSILLVYVFCSYSLASGIYCKLYLARLIALTGGKTVYMVKIPLHPDEARHSSPDLLPRMIRRPTDLLKLPTRNRFFAQVLHSFYKEDSQTEIPPLIEKQRYNFFMDDKELRYAPTSNHPLDVQTSKHFVLGNFGAAHVAGTFWLDYGAIYLFNDSGSHRPTGQRLKAAEPVFQRVFKPERGIELKEKIFRQPIRREEEMIYQPANR